MSSLAFRFAIGFSAITIVHLGQQLTVEQVLAKPRAHTSQLVCIAGHHLDFVHLFAQVELLQEVGQLEMRGKLRFSPKVKVFALTSRSCFSSASLCNLMSAVLLSFSTRSASTKAECKSSHRWFVGA